MVKIWVEWAPDLNSAPDTQIDALFVLATPNVRMRQYSSVAA